MRNTNPTFKRIISLFFYCLIIIFLTQYIKSINVQKIKEIDISRKLFLLALLVSQVARFIMPFAWYSLIKKFSILRFPIHDIIDIYSVSWMGRYIPGKITWIGSKISMTVEKGLSYSTATMSAVLESFCQLFSSSLVGLIFLSSVSYLMVLDHRINIIIWVFSILSLLFLTPPVYNRVLRFGYKVLKKKELSKKYYMDFGTILRVVGLIGIAKFFSGLSMGILAVSLGASLNFDRLIYIIGSTTISGALGMVALIAPAGIGVTETSNLFLCSPIMDREILLVFIVMMRILSVLSDFLFLLLAKLVKLFYMCIIKRRSG